MRVLLLAVATLICTVASAQQRPVRHLRIRPKYKPAGYRNVVTANAPNLFLAAGSEGLSGGLEYERFLDKYGGLSFTLPLYGFKTDGTVSPFGSRDGETSTALNGFFFAPALMIHPGGNAQKTDFSIGPAFLLGSLHRLDNKYVVSGTIGSKRVITESRETMTGFLINLDLSIHSNSAFVFAAQLGAGAILDAGPTQSAVVQLGIKMGGRF